MAKIKNLKAAGGRGLLAAGDAGDPKSKYLETTTTDFKIVVRIGEQDIELTSKDFAAIADIPNTGIHFELPEGDKIPLGSLKNFIEWLNANIPGCNIPVTVDTKDTKLDAILNGILGIDVAVTRLKADLDKQDEDKVYPPWTIDLWATGTAMDITDPKTAKPIELIKGISLVGGGVGMKHTWEKAKPTE